MICTIEEIKEKITPVARRYGLREVYLFGSYARGEAEEESDVDLLVDTGEETYGLFKSEGLRQDFAEALGIDVDIVHMEDFVLEIHTDSDFLNREQRKFKENVTREKVKLYEDNGQANHGTHLELLQGSGRDDRPLRQRL